MFAQITLIGRLGKDPETKSMGNGKNVTNFSLATTEKWTDGAGKKQERTEWHQIAAFDRTGEIAAEYLRKGDVAHVVGRPRTDIVDGRDGEKKYFHKVLADRITLLPNGRRGGQADTEEQDEADDRQQSDPAGAAESFDDDIPF